MDRGAWWATVHGDHKELGTTERLTPSLTSHLSRGFPGGSVVKKKICLPIQETQETWVRSRKEEKWQTTLQPGVRE